MSDFIYNITQSIVFLPTLVLYGHKKAFAEFQLLQLKKYTVNQLQKVGDHFSKIFQRFLY